jgi:hypothetical protein
MGGEAKFKHKTLPIKRGRLTAAFQLQKGSSPAWAETQAAAPSDSARARTRHDRPYGLGSRDMHFNRVKNGVIAINGIETGSASGRTVVCTRAT